FDGGGRGDARASRHVAIHQDVETRNALRLQPAGRAEHVQAARDVADPAPLARLPKRRGRLVEPYRHAVAKQRAHGNPDLFLHLRCVSALSSIRNAARCVNDSSQRDFTRLESRDTMRTDREDHMTNEQALALFEEAGALLTGHFKLSSGLHSDRYLEKFRLV